MNFDHKDMIIIVSMFFAIILMSFLYPALGLTGDQAAQNEVPEFNISPSEFDFVGDFPEAPDQAGRIDLRRDTREEHRWGIDDFHNLHGDSDDATEGAYVALANVSDDAQDPEMRIVVNNRDENALDSYNFTEEGVEKTHQNASYQLSFRSETMETVDLDGGGNGTLLEALMIIEDTPDEDDSGGLLGIGWSDIPVVGGLFEAGSNLAGVVIWIGQVIFWGIGWMFELVVNLLLIALDAIWFFAELFWFMLNTYSQVVAGAEEPLATLAVTLPLVILWLELMKFVMLAIWIIWIG